MNNKQEIVEPIITLAEELDIIRTLRPGLSDEDKLNILRNALKNRPTLEDRVAYISSMVNNPESNKQISIVSVFASAAISARALELLTHGLTEHEKNKMVTALIRLEKDRAYASPQDENTFMRGASLPKTALMSYLRDQMTDENALEFVKDPFKFISELDIPDHLKEVLREPIDSKISGGEPLYGFSHNMVFSMITGPVLKHFNDKWEAAKGTPQEKEAERQYKEAMKAVDSLTQINSLLIAKPEKLQTAIDKTFEKKITPEQIEKYVDSLEKLTTKMSDQYNPNSANISIEVLANYSEYSRSYNAIAARQTDEEKLLDLEKTIKDMDVDERIKYISIEDNLVKYGASSISTKALKLLTSGLSDSDKNKMVTALIRNEKERAYARPEDENTFMRGSSLAKTALMSYLKDQMTDKKAREFIKDPFKFISELPIPDHLKKVLREPIDSKIAGREPLYGFAHNMVFSMVTGPVLKHLNDKWEAAKGTPGEKAAEKEYLAAVKAVDKLTQINSLLIQKPENLEGAIQKTTEKKITPDHVIQYVSCLEDLTAKMSEKYKPRNATIAREIFGNFKEFQSSYNTQQPTSRKEAAQKFIQDVITTLSEKIAKFKAETLPKWTEKIKEAFTPNTGAKKSPDDEQRPRPGGTR